MTMRRGIAVIRVHKPARTSSPQTISNVPPKCAVKAGREKRIRVKRSTPVVPAKLGELSRKVIWLLRWGRKSGRVVLASPEVLDQMFRRAQRERQNADRGGLVSA